MGIVRPCVWEDQRMLPDAELAAAIEAVGMRRRHPVSEYDYRIDDVRLVASLLDFRLCMCSSNPEPATPPRLRVVRVDVAPGGHCWAASCFLVSPGRGGGAASSPSLQRGWKSFLVGGNCRRGG
jgi:hypothetical protein